MCCGGSRGQDGFSLFYMSFLLLSFFRWWCGMVCAPRRGRGERKASGWILSHRSNKSLLSRAAFCVQSANRQPEIISHNSLLRKQETLESPDDCEGAYERESGRTRKRAREARTGFSVFLLSSPVVLDGSLALWGHLCAFCSIVDHHIRENVGERDSLAFHLHAFQHLNNIWINPTPQKTKSNLKQST